MKQLYFLFLALVVSATSFGQVVISQVYGGASASQTSASYQSDFIELYNKGLTSVDLGTYSVQYVGPTPGTWTRKNLTGATIGPGKYFLIKCDSPANAHGLPLPTSDMDWTSVNLGTNNGIVALISNQTTITSGTCPSSNVLDIVGYGAAMCFETAAAPALTNSTAAIRTSNNDTGNNSNDFLALEPNPRNSTLSIGKDEISNFSLYPNPVKGGKVFINSANNHAERTVQVFDILGKQLVNQKGSQPSVDVSHLNKGIYIIKVAEEGKVATRKLILE